MKKTLALILALALLVCMMAGCAAKTEPSVTDGESTPPAASKNNADVSNGDTTDQEDVPTVKIALIAAMTGTNAMIGHYQSEGAQYMVDKINAAGGIKSLGGAKLELVIGDLQSDASLAKSVTESVCEDPDVVAITGASSSTYVLAMLPTIEKIGIPMVTANGSGSICEQGCNYIFQTSAKAPVMSAVQVDYLKYLKEDYGYDTDKVAILYRDDDFGITTAESTQTLVDGAGFDIVYSEAFPTTISDASSLVANAKNSGAGVLFLTAEAESSKLIIDSMNAINYHPVIIGSASGFTLPTFAEELGDYCVGMSSAAIFSYDCANIVNNSELNGYVQEFYTEYGYYPIEGTLYEMSHILIIADALERCASTDREVLRDAIAETSLDVMNPGGTMQFDETGASQNSTYVIYQWQKNETGEYVQTCVYPTEFKTGEFLDQRSAE